MKAQQIIPLIGMLALASCAPKAPEGPLPTPDEVRALWVVRYTLDHPDSVRAMVRRADEAGFNTLIVQIRGRGDAFYDARWEPKAESLYKERYDPLKLVLKEAHKRGIAVHVWLNTHLVANAEELPTRPGHVIFTRPDILAVPQPIARDLYDMDPSDARFVDALAQYARDNADHVEGLYTSPAVPEVKEHLYSIWMDILEKYDVDGMHFDYVRYPAPDYDRFGDGVLRDGAAGRPAGLHRLVPGGVGPIPARADHRAGRARVPRGEEAQTGRRGQRRRLRQL
jgi:uncharacterized lipoprotein YddW (UPF0748 family)